MVKFVNGNVNQLYVTWLIALLLTVAWSFPVNPYDFSIYIVIDWLNELWGCRDSV